MVRSFEDSVCNSFFSQMNENMFSGIVKRLLVQCGVTSEQVRFPASSVSMPGW